MKKRGIWNIPSYYKLCVMSHTIFGSSRIFASYNTDVFQIKKVFMLSIKAINFLLFIYFIPSFFRKALKDFYATLNWYFRLWIPEFICMTSHISFKSPTFHFIFKYCSIWTHGRISVPLQSQPKGIEILGTTFSNHN